MTIADEALAARVRQILSQDRRIAGLTVMVRAANGDIFMKGRVDTAEQKELMQLVCQGVPGVRRVVVDEIVVSEEES